MQDVNCLKQAARAEATEYLKAAKAETYNLMQKSAEADPMLHDAAHRKSSDRVAGAVELVQRTTELGIAQRADKKLTGALNKLVEARTELLAAEDPEKNPADPHRPRAREAQIAVKERLATTSLEEARSAAAVALAAWQAAQHAAGKDTQGNLKYQHSIDSANKWIKQLAVTD